MSDPDVEVDSKRLTRKEVISRLDGFLELIKNDYSFLWDGGNSSLVSKYGEHVTMPVRYSEEVSDCQREISLSNCLYNPTNNGFGSLGIVKEKDEFKFYLEKESIPDFLFCDNGSEVYDALEKQFVLDTEASMNKLTKEMCKGLEAVLKGEFDEKLANLRKKLQIE